MKIDMAKPLDKFCVFLCQRIKFVHIFGTSSMLHY
jgi:hypothetical protein